MHFRASSLAAATAAAACALAALPCAHAQPVKFTRRDSGMTYPPGYATPPSSMTPQAWLDALNAAVSAGKIPDIPPSLNREGPLAYPAGTDPADPNVCSWSYNNCEGPNDVTKAPKGQVGINFDDGPEQGTDILLQFLEQNNQSATHFLIGSNIQSYPDKFAQMANSPLHQLSVHTWSHPPYITSLSNEDVVAELGWTMQIIFDKSGKVPAWWRAPQGDADNRIRAIAEEVFGLRLCSWNGDSNDWELREGSGTIPGGQTADQVCQNIKDGFGSAVAAGTGPLVLEHELTDQSVHAFETCTWPLISQFNLQAHTIPDLFGEPWYANALDNTSPTNGQKDILPAEKQAIITPGASTSTAAASTPAGTVSSALHTTSGVVAASQAASAGPATSTRPTTVLNNNKSSGACAVRLSAAAALLSAAAALAVLL